MRRARATAFAPASVANVAVGFDVLGHALAAVGDRVTVEKIGGRAGLKRPLVIEDVVDDATGVSIAAIARDPRRNTATAGLAAFLKDARADFGLSIRIRKGIATGSGMGGSASSAVAAVVAANSLLARPRSLAELFDYALVGEAVASGSIHGDNVAPSLFGGLVLVRSARPRDVVLLPVPKGVSCVLIHPHREVSTKSARRILKPVVSLSDHIRQSANLGGLIAGCASGDLALIGRSLVDVIIEPQRQKLIPGFGDAKKAALKAGALGFSISGSGPSVFAWVAGAAGASGPQRVRRAILRAFEAQGVECDAWISPLDAGGAEVVA